MLYNLVIGGSARAEPVQTVSPPRTAGPLQTKQASLSRCTCVWNSKPIIFPLFKGALLNNLGPFFYGLSTVIIYKKKEEKRKTGNLATEHFMLIKDIYIYKNKRKKKKKNQAKRLQSMQLQKKKEK